MFAIELVKDRASREPLVAWQGASNALVMPKLLARLRDLGVHAFGRYNVLLITPPLTIMREEIALGMEALETALSELPSTP